jgi:hypothetical protein
LHCRTFSFSVSSSSVPSERQEEIECSIRKNKTNGSERRMLKMMNIERVRGKDDGEARRLDEDAKSWMK